jgi:hypothetical protein
MKAFKFEVNYDYKLRFLLDKTAVQTEDFNFRLTKKYIEKIYDLFLPMTLLED